jgi:O-antigen/teichoic acid export membrane protein
MTIASGAPPRPQVPVGAATVVSNRLVATNSAWLIGDKLVRLGLGLLVTVWLARHFGPETFGLWNYAIAFVAIFGAVSTLGMDGVIVRELVREGADIGALLGTALWLRFGAASMLAGAATSLMAVLRPGEWLPIVLVTANAATLIFQTSQVLDYHFQARMHSRTPVIATNTAYVAATLLRLALLGADAPIAWLGGTLVIEAALTGLLLWWAWRRDNVTGLRWHWDAATARLLLRESWPLIFSSVAVVIYMRVDQIMLASIAGDHEVGQFSAALRIAEIWYFIPMSIATAAFPMIVARRSQGEAVYEAYVQRLYDLMAWLGIAVAAAVTVLAPHLTSMLYGTAYAEAGRILEVQIWAGVAVAMSFVHSRWLLAEGLQRYGLLYTVAGALVNVVLNLILIPRHGAVGAAWATVSTQIGLLPIQVFLPKARRNFVLMMRTLTAPWRAWKSRGADGV